MINDPKVKLDGQLNVSFGMNGAIDPRDIPENQYASALNGICRTGIPHPRPGIRQLCNFGDLYGGEITQNLGYFKPDSTEDDDGNIITSLVPWITSFNLPKGNIQGSHSYVYGDDNFIVIVIDGTPYKLSIDGCKFFCQKLQMSSGTGPYLESAVPVYMEQADRYLVIQDGYSVPVIFDGATLRYADYSTPEKPEVPRGKAMFYISSRLWVADGYDLYAGDIFGGPTSVITFSGEGGLTVLGGLTFSFKERIIGMAGAPQLDTASGFGVLVVGCEHSTHAINAQITDRATWQTSQMQAVIFPDIGWDSHFSAVVVATDLMWRYNNEIRSFRNSRVGANSYYLNTLIMSMRPTSVEVGDLLKGDRTDLLEWVRGVYVNGRMLNSCLPATTANGGVISYGAVSLDFLTTSSAGPNGQTTTPNTPVWDGMWHGINIASFQKLYLDGHERTFILSTDDAGDNELWEISIEDVYDGLPYSRVPIDWLFDTRSFNCSSSFIIKRLLTLAHAYKQVEGELAVDLLYRADGDSCWTKMGSLTYCAKDTQDDGADVWMELQPHHLPEVRPPTPDADTDSATGRPERVGRSFQFRFYIHGNAWLYRLMPMTQELPDAARGAIAMT